MSHHQPALFKSKLIIKGLPPSITEEHARELLSDYTRDCFCVSFVPGRPPNPHNPLHHIRPAALVLDFKTEDALLNFTSKWQQVDCKEGDRHYTTTIEFAPIQRHYKGDSLKTRQRAAQGRLLLEQSKMYKAFLEEEFGKGDAEKTDASSSDFMNPEKQSEALRAGEARLKPWQVDPKLLKTTPLLEHLGKKTKAPPPADGGGGGDQGGGGGGGGGEGKKKKRSGKKKKQPPKDSDPAADDRKKLPHGFYIDTNPSEGHVKERGARKGQHSSARGGKQDGSSNIELKIYDLSIQDPVAEAKPRLRIANRPAHSELAAPGPGLQHHGTGDLPRKALESKDPTNQPVEEQSTQSTGDAKQAPPKKVFSLKGLREQASAGESHTSGPPKKVFFLKDLKDNHNVQ